MLAAGVWADEDLRHRKSQLVILYVYKLLLKTTSLLYMISLVNNAVKVLEYFFLEKEKRKLRFVVISLFICLFSGICCRFMCGSPWDEVCMASSPPGLIQQPT